MNLVDLDNKRIGHILQIQDKGENLKEVKPGTQVAVSIRGPTVGRQIKEGDELFVDLPESHAKGLRQLRDLLSGSESDALEDLAEIKRRTVRKFWGM